MNADAVLFDLDGVLVDSRSAFAGAINAALAASGLAAREPSELYGYLGPPLHATMQELAPGVDADLLVEAYRAHYRAHGAAASALFDGIAEALDALAARVPLVVATSKPAAMAAPLLEALGVADRFRAIVGPSLAARDEAKAVTVGRALGELNGARTPVMVGDRRHDVVGAAAHGIPCVGVLWGVGGERELREAGAAALVRAPSELPALLLAA